MALISCPNCGKQISDKAMECPDCGYKFSPNNGNTLHCEECGKELSADCKVCPECGCPVQSAANPQKVEVTGLSIGSLNKKTIITIAAIIAVIAIAIVVGVSISNNIKEAQAQEAAAQAQAAEEEKVRTYKNNLKKASDKMFLGAAKAESVAGLIHDVWYNTIYEKSDYETDKYTKVKGKFNDDFNTSLMLLFLDESYKSDTEYIENNQEEVKAIMKDLTNPPDECKGAYDALKQYYDAYLEFTNLALNPTGNLTSYTSSYNDADSKVLNCYKAMDIYLD